MKRTALYFVAPGTVEVRLEAVPDIGPTEVLVRTAVSAISAGTEMLIYRGQFPGAASESVDKISTDLSYPMAYGYACVGQVVELGSSIDRMWQDRLVFAFRPHASHFVCTPRDLLPVPDGVPVEEAAFLPNMETAVNLIQDGAPILGERVLVLGQGIVGLLSTALLREFPLAGLVTADRYELRRTVSAQLGVAAALDPASGDFRELAAGQSSGDSRGFDLVLEITGSPDALNNSIALTAFSGRILVASWYGLKSAPLELGAGFHRSRIRILSSQVSSISPELSGRWDKDRRFGVAWDALRRIRPAKWITHRFGLDQAAEAYALLDRSPETALQVMFDYS